MNDLVKAKQQELLEKYQKEVPDFQAGKQQVFSLLLSIAILSVINLIGGIVYYGAIHYLLAIFCLVIGLLSIGIFLFWAYLIYYHGQKAVVYLQLAGGIFGFFYIMIFLMSIFMSSGIIVWGIIGVIFQISVAIILIYSDKCKTYLEVMSKVRKEAMLELRRERLQNQQKSI